MSSRERAETQRSVVIIEDERLLAGALAVALPAHADVRVLATAATVRGGIDAVARHRPELVIADFRLPDGDIVDHLPALREAAPGARVLVYTGWADESGLLRTLDGGAAGYVEKTSSVEDFADAARRVLAGEIVVSPKLVPLLAHRALGTRAAGELTVRELQILDLVATGRSTQDIADELFLSRNTVRNNISRVLAKLGVRTRLDAVRVGVERGLIRYDPPGR